MKPIPVLSRIHPAGLALADQALVSAANFLITIAAARCLTIDEFGAFSLAWAIMLFAGGIHQSLVLQPLAVLYAEHTPATAPAYLRALERLHLFQPALILPIAAIAWWFPAWNGLILTAGLAVLARQAAEFERRAAYALTDSARALLVDLVACGPLMICAAIWWVRPQPIASSTFMLAVAMPALLGWLTGRRLLLSVRGPDVPSPDDVPVRHHVLRHWAFGKWVLASTLAAYGCGVLYPALIAGLMSLREVAALAAARSLVGITHIAMMGISAYTVPQARAAFIQQGWPGLSRTSRRSFLLLSACMLPLLAACALFPAEILALFIKSDYAGNAWILRAFAVIYFLQMFNVHGTNLLHALKEPRAKAAATFSVSLTTIVLGPFLIARWGLEGAVTSLVVGEIVMLGAMAVWLIPLYRRKRQESATAPSPLQDPPF